MVYVFAGVWREGARLQKRKPFGVLIETSQCDGAASIKLRYKCRRGPVIAEGKDCLVCGAAPSPPDHSHEGARTTDIGSRATWTHPHTMKVERAFGPCSSGSGEGPVREASDEIALNPLLALLSGRVVCASPPLWTHGLCGYLGDKRSPQHYTPIRPTKRFSVDFPFS